MPNINDIATAVYSELANNSSLIAAATVYKGKKRPSGAVSPALTVDVRRLERGEGEGMWICDIMVTVFTNILSNRMPDHDTHAELGRLIRTILSDTTLTINNAQALPLIEGGANLPEWDRDHDSESWQEFTFGLVFMQFE